MIYLIVPLIILVINYDSSIITYCVCKYYLSCAKYYLLKHQNFFFYSPFINGNEIYILLSILHKPRGNKLICVYRTIIFQILWQSEGYDFDYVIFPRVTKIHFIDLLIINTCIWFSN